MKNQYRSRSKQAGLVFPVGRIRKILRYGHYAPRISKMTPIYLAGVLEYLSAEILELSSEAARENGKMRIMPRHILLALKNDEELTRMLSGVMISQGGVAPYIHNNLLPKKTVKTAN